MNTTTQGWGHTARRVIGLALFALALTPCLSAHAQPRTFGLLPPAAASGPPARYLDEASLRVDLGTGGSSDGYKFRVTVTGQVHGRALSQADAVTLEYKVGTRVVATARCAVEGYDGFRWPNLDGYAVGSFSCMTEPVIDTAEDAVIQLTYRDDEDDRAIPFRPLSVRVGAASNWNYGTDHNYQNYVNNHELLGSSTLWLRQAPFAEGDTRVMFTFWANPGSATRQPDDLSLRCSLNGERIRENITVAGVMMHQRGGDTADYHPQGGTDDGYGYVYYELATAFSYAGRGFNGGYDLAAHPGAYVCEVRIAGTPVREFRFTVNADGSIPAHPEQLGANPLYITPHRVLLDTRFPTPPAWDHGIDPAAIRAGGFFGRAWRDVASLAAMFTALPPAVVGVLDAPALPAGVTGHGFIRPAAAAGRGGSSRGGSSASSMSSRMR